MGVVIHTDGACVGNPGPGGFGVVLIHDGRREEMSEGFRKTTNNRMEVRHIVKFKWIKGHAGNIENDRCDWLAVRAANGRHLAPDRRYERLSKF